MTSELTKLDSVDHKILLMKLDGYSIRSVDNNLIKNFPENHIQ